MIDPKSAVVLAGAAGNSKAGVVLIEKISEAVGGIFRPMQIRRIAEAEAKADIIKAQSKIEISEMENRALQRWIHEEGQKQQNMEAITQQAIPYLEEDSRPEALDRDWLANFFDRCRLVTDVEMQSLWAKLLAGEANGPGKYSKRIISLVSTFEKQDAELFTKLCRYCVDIAGPTPLIYDPSDSIYTENGLTFNTLSHLETIGLIKFESLAGFVKNGIGKAGFVKYFNEDLYIEFEKPAGNSLSIGKVLFTQAGGQLAQISGASPIPSFIPYLRTQWEKLGYKTQPSSSAQSPEQ